MCRNGTCQGHCRKNGIRRPESCPRSDFTTLTITIPVTNEQPPVETPMLLPPDGVPTTIETITRPPIAA